MLASLSGHARGVGASGQSAGPGFDSPTEGRGADRISGVVRMPDICSPSVSPAVVYLESRRAAGRPGKPAEVRRDGRPDATPEIGAGRISEGLQFTPRVQAIALGQTVRFTNQDGETHNVHAVTPGFPFNQSMAPGRPRTSRRSSRA